jgi:adenine-specific DNA methylase
MGPGDACAGIISAHYAGTYFGIVQAVEIDRIRGGIARSAETGHISPWEESVLLTALLSAASECAFSAGKHYAQPHRIRPDKDLSFIRSRILSDRSKDLGEIFHARLAAIIRAACSAGPGHATRRLTLEENSADPYLMGRFQAIYADPPYTAQQYSRFYHVPEIICAYRVPRLQEVDGRVTRGIYPEGRFKSAFCSRRQVKAAFGDLVELASAHEAVLFLSYSGSRTGETGNARAIGVDDLRALLRGAFGSRNVEERELEIGYRQFNNRGSSVDGRDDFELLFVATPDA